MSTPDINGGYDGVPWVKPSVGKKDGKVRISKEVISQIATQELLRVIGVRASKDQNVKKTSEGVNVSVQEFDEPSIVVDAFIETKYGLRIPDIAWYVQESIKNTLEQNTGYKVKAVNVFVQAVYIEDVKQPGNVFMPNERPPKADFFGTAQAAGGLSSEKAEPQKMPVAEMPVVEQPVEENPVEENPVEKIPVEEKLPKKDKTSIFGRSRISDKEHESS
ncbi:MAG: Asp23/Gls24 family envelope stress response protein [Thermovirgaceae bacterium]|nr:Asp23/Gls24 family envelope stress response protein [Thermovirgaceae bacterium]